MTKSKGRSDFILFGTIVFLLIFGMQALFSSSTPLGASEFQDPAFFLIRQLGWAALGVILMVVCWRIPFQKWRLFATPMIGLAFVLEILVMMPGTGTEVYGAQRWVSLGPLPPFQPSEFAKLAVIVFASAWLTAKRSKINSFREGFLPLLLIVLALAAFVYKQPDLGTTIVIITILAVTYFLAGAPFHILGMLASAGAVAAIPLLVSASYRQSRLEAFFDPWKDPLGNGYHIIQSLIAIGSGGLTGVGLGASRQKFYYLFSAHTDAVFAVISEELGFIGAFAMIALFGVFAYRGYRIAAKCPDMFGALVAGGITTWLCVQAFINIGGITQSIPFTGIPLPFISSGGSSLASTMAATGILLSISRSLKEEPAPDSQTRLATARA